MTAEPTHEHGYEKGDAPRYEQGPGPAHANSPGPAYANSPGPAYATSPEPAYDKSPGRRDEGGPERHAAPGDERVATVPRLQRGTRTAVLARGLVLLLSFVCMVGFAVLLARATLVPSPGSTDLTHTNLRPGDSISAYLDQPDFKDTIKQIGGNILLGVPFGVLLPMLMPRARGLARVAAVTALVMLMVETAQGVLVTGRAFDIDDVLLNTAGALIGYLLAGRRLGRALHPRRHHWWHRWTRKGERPAGSGGKALPGPVVSSGHPPVPPHP
ncbi:VanZ family protein [Streptomyces sp. NPDC017941]|uniref:VanZ family protein n=1 Tax=Streptomyces sp. NPDC017941 TaxID=3365018 RepID=UPI0037A95421